ncbi:retropepsin-like aspartic protease family protein [Altererythrobacter aquiaggeris]|uniref:retropepsin-like aspartic protease family protein n=1 Tax=Aestuarierythrobacter aquiaggeris TaxID=1898396 RepID=UPI003015BDFC
MDVKTLWDAAARLVASVPQSGLLIAVLAALLVGWAGAVLIRKGFVLGRFIRAGSTLALIAIMLTVVLQLARFDPRFDMVMPESMAARQQVTGGETRITLAPDGHFWLRASVNGEPVKFMVDTGATLTALSQGAADRAGLEPRRGGIPIRLNTANGAVAAQLSTIDELRFGNVAARGLDVVIAPNLGETNVIGMNLLTRLASWRVEGQTMILVPGNPEPAIAVEQLE